MNSACTPRCFTGGRKSSSRTARPPSSRKRDRTTRPEQERIAYLEKKIQTKDEVLAELTAEHVARNKTLGELPSPFSFLPPEKETPAIVSLSSTGSRPS
jgi:hypothetical protein